MVARRRPTLPRLETQYHGRWCVSRPCSGWERVFQHRDSHRATVQDLVGWMNCLMCVVFAYFGAVRGEPFDGFVAVFDVYGVLSGD